MFPIRTLKCTIQRFLLFKIRPTCVQCLLHDLFLSGKEFQAFRILYITLVLTRVLRVREYDTRPFLFECCKCVANENKENNEHSLISIFCSCGDILMLPILPQWLALLADNVPTTVADVVCVFFNVQVTLDIPLDCSSYQIHLLWARYTSRSF